MTKSGQIGNLSFLCRSQSIPEFLFTQAASGEQSAPLGSLKPPESKATQFIHLHLPNK